MGFLTLRKKIPQHLASVNSRKPNARRLWGIVFLIGMVASTLYSQAHADCGPAAKSGDFLSYSIEPKLDGTSLSLEVTVSFRLGGKKSVHLLLPSEWEGQRNLEHSINGLEVLSPGASLKATDQAPLKELTFSAGQLVRFRYLATRDWNGSIVASSYFRVMLQPTYFQVTGQNFIVHPDLPIDREISISLEWKNLPQGWTALSSFGGDSLCHTAVERSVKIWNGLFIGGDLRVSRVDAEGQPVFIATRGRWNFADAAFNRLAAGILCTERKFWHDSEAPNYLISLLPNDEGPGNYGGLAMEDSFALFMSPESSIDFSIKFLLAHEMFHNWNAGQLGEVGGDPPYWFSEGFTDYYARVLLLRGGFVSQTEYIGDIQAAYREYLGSSLRHLSGKSAEQRFLTDGDVQRLLYLRGNFLALRWADLIDRESKGGQSLDEAMLELRHTAQRKEVGLTDSYLASHFDAYTGKIASSDVHKYIESGETIPLGDRLVPRPDLSPR